MSFVALKQAAVNPINGNRTLILSPFKSVNIPKRLGLNFNLANLPSEKSANEARANSKAPAVMFPLKKK